MSEKIEGYSYQEHEPTPNNPCEIKTILCNDIEIPVEFLKQNFVTVDGKKYIELQQENKQLKEKMAEIVKYKGLESCSTATQYMAKANVYKMYDTHIKKLEEINDKLKQQLDLYKEVVEEVR